MPGPLTMRSGTYSARVLRMAFDLRKAGLEILLDHSAGDEVSPPSKPPEWIIKSSVVLLVGSHLI